MMIRIVSYYGKGMSLKPLDLIFILVVLVLGLPTKSSFSEHQKEQPAQEVPIRASSDVSIAKCADQLVKRTDEKNRLRSDSLSPFWGQELVGSDLAREVIQKEREVQTHSVPIGVIDGGVYPDRIKGPLSEALTIALKDDPIKTSSHGTGAANLINAPSPIGAGEKAILTAFSDNHTRSHYIRAARRMAEGNPRIINISQGMRGSKRVYDHLKKMAETSLLSIAAGNSFPFDLEENLTKASGFVVGSIGAQGFVTESSQENERVDILAPGDGWLQTMKSKDDSISRLGSTSGATALFSGVLSNALAYLPDLTLQEAKLLVQKSAIPTWNVRVGDKKNGAGMVNGYKLVMVARKLVSEGFRKKGGDERRAILSDPSTYRFDSAEDLERKYKEARQLLAESDCTKKKTGLHQMRKIYFLSAGNKDPNIEAWANGAKDTIAKVYDQMGLSGNASFYRSLITGTEKEHLTKMLDSEWSDDRGNALRAAAVIDPDGIEELLTKALDDKDIGVRFTAMGVAANTPSVSIDFFKKALQNDSENVRRGAGRIMKNKPGAGKLIKEIFSSVESFERLVHGTHGENGNTKYGLLGGMSEVGDEGLEILKSIWDEPFETARAKLFWSYKDHAAKNFPYFGDSAKSYSLAALSDPHSADDIVRALAFTDEPDWDLIKKAIHWEYKPSKHFSTSDPEGYEQRIHKDAAWAAVMHYADGRSPAPLGKESIPALEEIRAEYAKDDFWGTFDVLDLLDEVIEVLKRE